MPAHLTWGSMKELTVESQKIIEYHLRGVANFVEKAKNGLDRKKKEQRDVWDQLDLAESRLMSLSLFLGLISEDGEAT